LLAWVVVGENPGVYTLMGGGVVVGALFISNVVAMKRARLRYPL
jgi:hypothetical protein